MFERIVKMLGLFVGDMGVLATPRSPRWKSVRREHLLANPRCIVCGSTRGVVPHHVVPFHVAPERELDPSNLVTLCEGPTFNCHLFFGHLKRWDRHNPDVTEDAAHWRTRIAGGDAGQ